MRCIRFCCAIWLLTAAACLAQNEIVVISGFPRNIGISHPSSASTPHSKTLQGAAHMLEAEPELVLICEGQADGVEYSQSHDPKNAAIALSRAIWLKNILVTTYGVDPTRIRLSASTVLSQDEEGTYRLVRLHLYRSDTRSYVTWDELDAVVDSLADRFTAHSDSLAALAGRLHVGETMVKNGLGKPKMPIMFGLGVGAFGLPGLASCKLQGGLPRTYAEIQAGIWPFQHTKTYNQEQFKVHEWYVQVLLVTKPWKDTPMELLVGWVQQEEVISGLGTYARRYRGATGGIRMPLFSSLQFDLEYARLEHTRISDTKASWQNYLKFGIFFTKRWGGRS